VSLSLIREMRGRSLYRAAWVAPAIPYRTDAAVSAGGFATALLITVLVAALVFIRRRGWITLPGTTRAPVASEGIQVQASRRLSIASTAHVLSYQGNTYLVVESTRGTQATVTRIEAEKHDGETP
jgi:hypothetical protein